MIEDQMHAKPTEKQKANWVQNLLEGAACTDIKYVPVGERESCCDFQRFDGNVWLFAFPHFSAAHLLIVSNERESPFWTTLMP